MGSGKGGGGGGEGEVVPGSDWLLLLLLLKMSDYKRWLLTKRYISWRSTGKWLVVKGTSKVMSGKVSYSKYISTFYFVCVLMTS